MEAVSIVNSLEFQKVRRETELVLGRCGKGRGIRMEKSSEV